MQAQSFQNLVTILKNLKEKVKCAICLDIIHDVIELECHHKYCSHCINELKVQDKKPVCPLCKKPIKKRSTLYKDLFADKLSTFVSEACNVLQSKYGFEVEQLDKDKNLINDICKKKAFKDTENLTISRSKIIKTNPALIESVEKDAFDKLSDVKHVRTYENKRKRAKRKSNNHQLHTFQDNNNKIKVLDWLNANESRLNKITQSQKSIEVLDADALDLPSISQIPPRPKHKTRSQSLDMKNKEVPHAPLKRYRSFTSNLNDDDYTIEEINTEKIERNAIQYILEDACLANIESMNVTSNKDTSLRKGKVKPKANNSSTVIKVPSPVSSSTSGWDRIKEVKNSIKKNAKVPKQLHITLKPTSPTKQNRNRNGKQIADSKAAGTNKKLPTKKKDLPKEHKLNKEENIEDNKCFNLIDLENYISVNIQNVNVDTQSKLKNKDAVSLPIVTEQKQNESAKNDDNLNDIFLMATQKSDEVANIEKILKCDVNINPTLNQSQENQIDLSLHLNKIPTVKFEQQKYKNLEHAINDLQSKVDYCISHVSCRNDVISDALQQCFDTIKQYIVTVKGMNSQKVDHFTKAVQTVKCLKTNVETQTKNCITFETGVQTEINIDNKYILEENVENLYPNTQVLETEIKNQKSGNKSIHEPLNKSLNVNESQELCNKSLSRRQGILTGRNTLNTIEKPIENVTMSGEPSNSVLVFTLDPPKEKSSKKINRKLTFSGNETKRFKRIRVATSDSDSEEEHSTKKARSKYLRDDLSVHFTETAVPESNENLDDNSEIYMEYDKVLDEILGKSHIDNNRPQKEVPKGRTQNEGSQMNDDELNAICDRLISQSREKIHVSQKPGTSKPTQSQKSKKMDDEFNSIFGNNTFDDPVDLDQLDKDISQYNKKIKLNSLIEEKSDVVESSVIQNQSVKRFKSDTSDKKKSNCNSNRDPNVNSESLFANETTLHNIDKKKGLTPKVMDSVLNKINNEMDMFPDDELDEEMAAINFTEEERKAGQNMENIKIIENIKIKSQNKPNGKNLKEEICVSDSNDELFSDDDIVETTPQKLSQPKYSNINISSPHFKIPAPDVPVSEELNICLPPPPGFGDENEISESENNTTVIENNTVKFVNKSSLTPDRLSQVFEISKPGVSKLNNSTHIAPMDISLPILSHNESSLITPKRSSMSKSDLSLVHSTPHTQNINRDTLGLSPITREKLSQPTKEKSNLIEIAQNSKYTPLVTTKKAPPKKQDIMTSVPNQKSILNYVKPSQENKTSRKPCIAYTRILSKNEAIVSRFKAADLVNVSSTFGPHVTHMVVLVDEEGCVKAHTAKYVLAVAAGVWVVRFEWVEDCLRNRCILPEEPYEVLDVSGAPGPKMSRLTRLSNPLLTGYRLYCAPPFSNISREDAENAIKLLGGETVLDLKELSHNQRYTNLIVTDTTATDDTEKFEYWLEKYKIVTVDVEWLTKSIGQYKIISIRPYVLCSDDSICDLGYPAHLIESVPLTFSENL